MPLGLRLQHAVFDRLVYAKLRDALGGRSSTPSPAARRSATGSATSSAASGSSILEGYGLTETTAPATVNRPRRPEDRHRRPRRCPGVDVRIADDGEICSPRRQGLRGYWNNEEATARGHRRDGWFHTGDIGELDDEGFLRITGRKKEILVTAGGKNVAPAVLEDRLRAHPLVSQCIVVGDGKPFIAALVTLDEEMYPAWAGNHGLSDVPFSKASDDERIHAEIQKAVDNANTAVSKAESIRKFVILDTDFTEQSGHLTPSLKLKRNVVMRDFGDEVDALYGG